MTLKHLAHRSAQALLSSPPLDPHSVAFGMPSLRDPAPSRAQRAESPGTRADFADTLRERSKASDHAARSDPSSNAAAKQTTASEPDVSAPDAENAGESDNASAPAAGKPEAQPAPASADTQNSSDPNDAVDPTQSSNAPPAQVSAAIEIKTQPATIQDLNALLLQGQAPPRFTLVSPEHQPGAFTKDGTSTRAHRAPSPAASEHRSNQGSESGVNARESVPSARDSSARHADFARADQAKPHEPPAPTSRSDNAPPPSASAGTQGTAQPPIGPVSAPTPAPIAISPAAPEAATTSTQIVPTRASSPHALLDRLGAASAKPTTPAAARPDPNAPVLAAQIQRGLAAALNQKTGAVTLRLTPETLGQLKIQVKVSAGSLTAAFEVSSAKTRDTLNRSLDTLRQGLKDKGLEVAEFKITLAPNLPQRDLGLDPLPHPAPSTHDAPAHSSPDGQQMTAHDGGSPGHRHPDHERATSASTSATDAPETAVDLAALSPDSVADALGRSRYIALPGGRLGLVALA